jgi:hypothetical protein
VVAVRYLTVTPVMTARYLTVTGGMVARYLTVTPGVAVRNLTATLEMTARYLTVTVGEAAKYISRLLRGGREIPHGHPGDYRELPRVTAGVGGVGVGGVSRGPRAGADLEAYRGNPNG